MCERTSGSLWPFERETKRRALEDSEESCCTRVVILIFRKVAINKIIKCDDNEYFHYSF